MNKERAAEICEMLASGHSLRASCEALGGPTPAAVLQWVKTDEEFGKQYAHARELGYSLLADQILEISDDSAGDVRTTEDGRELVDSERVARSKLRVDSRKWLLSKMLPKVYGDKLDLTSDGKAMPGVSPVFNITLTDK